MTPAPEIWIVDDEPDARAIFGRALSDGGYRIATFRDGAEVLDRFRTEAPALLLLDVGMPGLSGWDTLKEWRRRGGTQPVLMITASNDVDSRVRGLENGADDYLGKPCSPAEVLARVRALLRRVPRARPAETKPLRLGAVTVDLEKKTALKAGGPLRLTRTDYALLTLLAETPGKPVSRELILQRVWDGHSGGSHALDTHLWRLRKKLGDTGEGPPLIQNLPGIGYVLTAGA